MQLLRKTVLFSLAIIAFQACKTEVPGSTTPYKEDLSSYRIKVLPPEINTDTDQDPENSNISIGSPEEIKLTVAPPVFQQDIKNNIEQLQQQQAIQNTSITQVQGFSLLIYSGRSRIDGEKIYNDLAPVYETKFLFDAPDWKVKAGQYLSRLEAHQALIQIQKEYPRAIIIPDRITFNSENYLQE